MFLFVGIVFLGVAHCAIGQESLGSKARELIRNAKAGDDLPEGVSVRIWADMGGRKDGKTLKEHWEFSTGKVHQVVREEQQTVRFKSRKCETKGMLFALKKGWILKIEAREGMGEPTLLADTGFQIGGRSITIHIDGKVALLVVEHCTGGGYRVTNSKALTKLYDKLAAKARAPFKSQE